MDVYNVTKLFTSPANHVAGTANITRRLEATCATLQTRPVLDCGRRAVWFALSTDRGKPTTSIGSEEEGGMPRAQRGQQDKLERWAGILRTALFVNLDQVVVVHVICGRVRTFMQSRAVSPQ